MKRTYTEFIRLLVKGIFSGVTIFFWLNLTYRFLTLNFFQSFPRHKFVFALFGDSLHSISAE